MKAVLLDSDVVVEVLRQRDSAVCERWENFIQSAHPVVCTPITLAELWHGARPPEFAALKMFFDGIECLPIDRTIGHRAGDYLRQFAKSHHLQLGDALIAATAAVNGLALWTRNHKHYPMKDIEFF